MSLEVLKLVVGLLEKYTQRATYGAVAGVVGGIAQGVMQGRPKTPLNSWVVAKKNHLPTGYTEKQQHTLLTNREHVIENAADLLRWLKHPK